MNELKDNLTNYQKIIADIGGTNARFAVLNGDGSIQDEIVLKGKDHLDFVSAYQEYTRLIGNPQVTKAAIAIANPINDDVIDMTNHNWTFSIEEARNELSLDSLVFKNDFEALAMSIPFLSSSDLYKIGSGNIKKKSPIGVLGPGTGLGVSGLIYSGEKWIPLASEGGHVSFSPTTAREIKIFEACLSKHSHVSAERLVSGPGLKRLYNIICQLDEIDAQSGITEHEISQFAINMSDSQCMEALDVFCGLLGVIAGNLALTLGAKGGIYIGGGIIPKLGTFFEKSSFREKFESKGRFNNYLQDIPVFVIKSQYPALIGIGQVFE